MATTWHETTLGGKQTALLADGSLLAFPDIEVSGAGRRVRAVGSTTSYAYGDWPEAMMDALRQQAAARGTQPWTTVPESYHQTHMERLATDNPKRNPWPSWIRSAEEGSTYVSMWWRFRHADLPIEAVIGAETSPDGYYPEIRLGLMPQAQSGHYLHYRTDPVQVSIGGIADFLRYGGFDNVSDDQAPRSWDELRELNDTAINNPNHVTSTRWLLNVISTVEDMAYFEVPDTRVRASDGTFGTLRLELIETNVPRELVNSLRSFIEDQPDLKDALRHYESFRNIMGGLGMKFEDLTASDLFRGLEGEGNLLEVGVERGSDNARTPDDRRETHHQLFLNLQTGRYVTACSVRDSDNDDEVAHKWEEQLMMARFSGTEREFLRFAAKQRIEPSRRKARKIAER